MRFDIPSGWGTVMKGTIGISHLFSNWVKFHPHCLRLMHHGLVALEQLLSPDCKVLLSWKELCCLVPTLMYAVPQWFREIESALGVHPTQVQERVFTLPAPLGPLVGPNPFRTSLLSFCPVVAKLSSFMAVFPISFPDDGDYFLAKLVGWEGGGEAGPIRYHLQHWCIAKPNDDPEGILYDRGYYVQCGGDCDTPQVCTSCVSSCC